MLQYSDTVVCVYVTNVYGLHNLHNEDINLAVSLPYLLFTASASISH